jgi:histidinol-phosphatase (PHP family)
MIDNHVHLQPHGQQPPVDRALLERYVECAAGAGIETITITEHLFRFREAFDLLYGWWDADPNPRLAALTRAYWQDHVNLSLPDYVRLIEEAKADGLPLRLGLEMDWIPGRADDLRVLLAPYAWDCVLGSVHYVGSFGIDDEAFDDEWQRRDVDAVWEEYGGLLEELAAAELVDVLAHPDIVKVLGYRPSTAARARLHWRIVEAATRHGLTLELNTKAMTKPVGEPSPHPDVVMAAFRAGVPLTFASDAHVPEAIGLEFSAAAELARAAGYAEYASFTRRRRRPLPIPVAAAG